jgi:hypothetical protein
MRRFVLSKRTATWHARVRWRERGGASMATEIEIDRLPVPFNEFHHPDVTGGKSMRVEAFRVSDGEVELDLAPAHRSDRL